LNASGPARLEGLDLFRGAAVAGMVIVNTPGSHEHVWWPLEHAAWHGFTPADLVFPAFLCAMGVALGLSFPRQVDGKLWARILRRSLLLIAIGWAWQMLARPGFETFRLFGVLPRLGLCYGLAAAIAILTARRDGEGRAALRISWLAGITAALLLGYWAAMMLVPVPGHGAGVLTPAGNLAGWVDRMIVGPAHMWRAGTDAAGNIVYDPEGLFSTLPALANVLLGVIAGAAWKRAPGRIGAIAAVSAMLVLAGLATAPVFPLNKALWTSSFALLSSGLSGLLLVLAVLAARTPVRKALAPFELLGMNALLGYILSLLMMLAALRSGFQDQAFGAIQGLVGDPWIASFLYALAALLVTLAALLPLHRRGIHLRL
jgi:predicted acyltransferase